MPADIEYINLELDGSTCLSFPKQIAFPPSLALPLPPMAVSEQLKFVTDWENAFRRKDYDFLVNGLDKDYKTIIYPKSLGVPVLSKEEWLPGLRDVLAIWTSAKVGYLSC